MSDPGLLVRSLGALGDLVGPAAILMRDGRIDRLDDPDPPAGDVRVADGTGLVAVPGFIELQVNGAVGHDFTTDPGSMWRVGPALAASGVTAFLPTVITSPRGSVDAALAAFRAQPDRLVPPGAMPLGLHVEGPYLSPVRRGAHALELLRDPDLDEIDGWLAVPGLRMLTLAPELPGALEAIARLAQAGVAVSIGHSDADAPTARRAVDAGARAATHLFNAMPPLGHRAPGVAGALLVDERVTLELILDGHHLHPMVVELVARAAPGRIALVSDAIAALGLPEGRHVLAERDVEVVNGAVRLPDGTLAGTATALDACVRAFADVTGSPHRAVAAVTEAPARLLGLEGNGSIIAGGPADVVFLDKQLRVRATFVAGRLAFATEVERWA